MIPENINDLSLSELMDMLVTNTLTLLELMNQRDADGKIIFDMRVELQIIQAAIEERKSKKLHIV